MKLILAISAMAIAGQAVADISAEVKRAFGNTIVSTYPDGRKGETWIAVDGTYTGMGRKKDRSSGKWRVKGDSICFKQSRPIPAPFNYCVKIPTTGFKSGFQSKAYTGEMATLTLVHGPTLPHEMDHARRVVISTSAVSTAVGPRPSLARTAAAKTMNRAPVKLIR